MTQAQMFPMSEEERIGLLRKNLQSAVDKLLAKRDAAAVALADAQDAEGLARGLLAVFDSMVAERAAQRGKSVMQTAADIVNSGALNTDDCTVTASVTPAMEAALKLKRSAEKAGIGLSFAVNGEEPIVITEPPAVDPITGEVDSKPEPAHDTKDVGKKCPDCMGEGRLPDKTGGGHHRCKKCEGTGSLQMPRTEPNVSVVIVLYPDSDEPVVTKIGEHTRYGELVADYFSSAGLTGKHDAKDWTVIAEDELTNEATAYGVRKLRDVIAGADYGKRLLVAAADQGSVTGADAENCDDCGRESCNLRQREGADHTGCGGNGWAAKAEESAA